MTTSILSITLTRDQLEAALLRWTQAFRNGETRTFEETQALPIEQVAKESADHLWRDLCDHSAPQPVRRWPGQPDPNP